jgi:hypothetical protein
MSWFLWQAWWRFCRELPWWLRWSRLRVAPHYCFSWDYGWVHPRQEEAACCDCFTDTCGLRQFWSREWREYLRERLQGKPEPRPLG